MGNEMTEELLGCPYCGAQSFEETFKARIMPKIEEQKFDRINHKEDCYMNVSGGAFERFARHNIKDVDRKWTPDEYRKYWNRRYNEKD